jgi:hypothetical protein
MRESHVLLRLCGRSGGFVGCETLERGKRIVLLWKKEAKKTDECSGIRKVMVMEEKQT